MKKSTNLKLLIEDLKHETLGMESLGHALEALGYTSRLIHSLAEKQRLKDPDLQYLGEQALMGLGSLFDVLAQYAFDRKNNLSEKLEKLELSHDEELTANEFCQVQKQKAA